MNYFKILNIRAALFLYDWSSLYNINPEFDALLNTLSGGRGFRVVKENTKVEDLRAMEKDPVPKFKPIWRKVFGKGT